MVICLGDAADAASHWDTMDMLIFLLINNLEILVYFLFLPQLSRISFASTLKELR